MHALEHSTAPRRLLIRQMLQGSGLYSLALIGQRIASLILVPIYTRYLTPADYGILDLTDQAVSVLAVLFGSNFSSSLFYFFFQHPEREWRNKTVKTNIIGSALAGIAAMLAGLLLASQISILVFQTPAMALYFRILFITTALSFIFESLLCWLRAEDLPHLFTGFSVAKLALAVFLACLFLIGFHWTITGVLLSNLVATFLLVIVLGAYAMRNMHASFDPKLFWEMMRFSLPLAVTGIALFIMHFADRFILQRHVSLSEIGIYSLAYKIGMIVAFIHSSFHTYWSSQAYRLLRRDDAARIFARTFTYMTTVLAFCALALVLTVQPALTLLATRQYRGAALIVPIIVAAYFARALGDYFRTIFAVQKRLSWDAACNWVGAAVCLAGYFLLIPRYGMWGAATATAITFVVVGILAYSLSVRLMTFYLERLRLLKLGAVTLFLFLIHLSISAGTFWTQFAAASGLLLLYPCLLWATGFFTLEEKIEFRSLLRSFGGILRFPGNAS